MIVKSIYLLSVRALHLGEVEKADGGIAAIERFPIRLCTMPC